MATAKVVILAEVRMRKRQQALLNFWLGWWFWWLPR